MILSFICEAFPVMFFKKQMSDGSRRVIEIVEALGVEDGGVRTRTLYRYDAQTGRHEKVHPISEALAQTLAENDAPADTIKKFT